MGLFSSVSKVVSSITGGGSSSWIGDAVGLAGTVLGYFGSEDEKKAVSKAADRQEAELIRVAMANKEISLYDANAARNIGITRRFEADAEAGIMYNNMQKLLSAQRVRFAKSGVALKMGTPVDVMERTTRAAAKDIMNIKYKGRSAKAEADSLAQRYKLLGDKGMRDSAATASLIQEAAADKEDAITWNQWGTVASDIYGWVK